MLEPKLSIITPTCGRDTLLASIGSSRSQLKVQDEHVIIMDGEINPLYKAFLTTLAKADTRYKILQTEAAHRSGNPQRDLGIQHATGDYLIFLDDDDWLAPTALNSVRTRAPSEPRPMMFTVQHLAYKQLLNTTTYIRNVDICGARLVAPNIPSKLGRWDDIYTAEAIRASQREFAFIEQVLAHYPEGPLWIDELLILVPTVGMGKLPDGE